SCSRGRGRRRGCATRRARRSSPTCWAALRPRRRRRRPSSSWPTPRPQTSARCEGQLVAQLFGVLRTRVRVRLEVAVEQLAQLLDLRGGHLRRGRFLARLAVVAVRALLRAGRLHLAAAARLVLAIGLGGLLGLGLDLFLDLLLALFL